MTFWTFALWVATALVIVGVALEEYEFVCKVFYCASRYGLPGLWKSAKRKGWRKSAHHVGFILLVLSLAAELLLQAKVEVDSNHALAAANTNAANANLEANRLRNAADITEERLLSERRLTARERWRLERVERAVLPRSLYVNWNALVASLKAVKLSPINIALVGKSMEASDLASNLMISFSQAGLMGQFIDLSAGPSDPHAGMHSSTGAYIITGAADGQSLAQILFQNFQIGGGSTSAESLPAAWSAIPKNMNCLVIEENNWAMAPPSGQPGEGLDEHGGADPAPH